MPHDIFSMQAAKALEYLIAVGFMLLFIPFWRYVNGQVVAREAVAVTARGMVPRMVEWFRLPASLSYHPGHTWARVEPDGMVTVGMDDFARKLVGGVAGVRLPAVGARIEQGEPAWTLLAGDRSVDMLSPVDGTVVAVNHQPVRREEPAGDPYGGGWFLKVKAPRLESNLRNLLSGELARRWLAEATDRIRLRLAPALGVLYQDGGMPVDGFARVLDPERWDQVAREFFLTSVAWEPAGRHEAGAHGGDHA